MKILNLTIFHLDFFSGRILNRFSKDLGSIDELLPKALLDAGQIIITVIGGIIVTVTVNYIFLLPVAIVSVFALAARVVFLRSSQNIKRIEGISTSLKTVVLDFGLTTQFLLFYLCLVLCFWVIELWLEQQDLTWSMPVRGTYTSAVTWPTVRLPQENSFCLCDYIPNITSLQGMMAREYYYFRLWYYFWNSEICIFLYFQQEAQCSRIWMRHYKV